MMQTSIGVLLCIGLLHTDFGNRKAVGKEGGERQSSSSTKPSFDIETDATGITRLVRHGDPNRVNFIREGGTLGKAVVRYRRAAGPWREARLTTTATPRHSDSTEETQSFGTLFVMESEEADVDLRLTSRFLEQEGSLRWSLQLKNNGDNPREIGDLALPLPMNTVYTRDVEETFSRRVFKHGFISGHGSFVFWLPVSGIGPHLIMTPAEGTKLEYFAETGFDYAHGRGNYTVFIHSATAGQKETRGTWRQKHTSVVIEPGATVNYAFHFHWADDYRGLREVLYQHDGFDVHVVPGMVVPINLYAMFALRTKNKIEAIEPEFPEGTCVDYLGERAKDVHVYRVSFSRLGENLLRVKYGDDRFMDLEFFATQTLETLIKKRARFIAKKQQHRDPTKWYDGLFSLWDTRMPEGKNLLGPDNLGGQHPYAVSGSDDPSNCKCLYLSQKNVAFPDAREVEALEYFLENFVWGKHQRTDEETPHPYGIYGCPSWKVSRFSDIGLNSGGHGRERMWRTFDYTTYFALYYNMYLIAKRDPQLTKYLDADRYLERAFGTAKAFFEVPYNINMDHRWAFQGWTEWAYTIGNFHEKYLLDIVEALEREGRQADADWLRAQWEKKVKFFLYDDPYPYVSEMPVDSTAYESSYALAKYALVHGLEPDEKLWQNKNTGQWYSHPKIDPKRHREFLTRQLLANLACRGCLETSYYHLGSDFRAMGSSGYTLSYMSQMGGWAVLDQGLYFSRKPAELIRLGYASMLSSWALMNAGTPESDYGYWAPGALHDGSVGWGFMPQKFAGDWNPGVQAIPRGAWPVCGEIDHGLTAGIEAISTVVFDDPLFGPFAFGGLLETADTTLRVIPRDGVRQRLHVLWKGRRLHAQLSRDGFARERQIEIAKDFSALQFMVENRASTEHTSTFTVAGMPCGNYSVTIDGKPLGQAIENSEDRMTVKLPLAKARKQHVRIELIANRLPVD